MPAPNEPIKLPGHMAITQWAVAGGILGMPVHIIFQDYPKSIVAEVYRRLAKWVEHDRTLIVHDDRGLRQLEEALRLKEKTPPPRVVLLSQSKLFDRAAWMLEMHRPADGCRPSVCPAILTAQAHEVGSDGPGPGLVLHGSSPSVRSTSDWLERGVSFSSSSLQISPEQVDIDPRIRMLVETGESKASSQLQFKDKQILKGLIAGAARLRVIDAPCLRLVVGLDDYRVVCDAIKSAATQPADESFDPLTLAMVQRANAYVRNKSEWDISRLATTARPVELNNASSTEITRSELTDLGNPRSPIVRDLIVSLKQMGREGLTCFSGLGTVRQLPDSVAWQNATPADLADRLLSWSPKQVRNRFNRLVTDGLITGRRCSGNKPWVYQLPDTLSCSLSPFQSLPTPERLGTVPLHDLAGLASAPDMGRPNEMNNHDFGRNGNQLPSPTTNFGGPRHGIYSVIGVPRNLRTSSALRTRV